jgi:hypothetical protein
MGDRKFPSTNAPECFPIAPFQISADVRYCRVVPSLAAICLAASSKASSCSTAWPNPAITIVISSATGRRGTSRHWPARQASPADTRRQFVEHVPQDVLGIKPVGHATPDEAPQPTALPVQDGGQFRVAERRVVGCAVVSHRVPLDCSRTLPRRRRPRRLARRAATDTIESAITGTSATRRLCPIRVSRAVLRQECSMNPAGRRPSGPPPIEATTKCAVRP